MPKKAKKSISKKKAKKFSDPVIPNSQRPLNRRTPSKTVKRRTPKATEGIPNRNTLSVEERAELRKESMEHVGLNMASRLKHPGGRTKIFSTPQDLIETFEEYISWNKKNPWYKYDVKNTRMGLEQVAIPLGRPYTLSGFCLFAGVGSVYFNQFKSNLKKDDKFYVEFSQVIHWIIRTQKFEGASIGAFNANLMSYDLGIRKDIPTGGLGGITINVTNETHNALLEEVKAKLEALDKEETKDDNGGTTGF
jgi:hypothetical protein